MEIKKLPNKLIHFIKEVRIELKRVTWPTRQEAIKNTLIVIVFTLAVAFFLGGLDFIFNLLLKQII